MKEKKEKKQKQRQKQRQKQSQNVRVVVNIPSEPKPRRRSRAPRKKIVEEIEPQLFRQLPPVVYMTPPQVTHYGGFPREDFVSVPIAEKPSISIEPVAKPAKILGAEPKSIRFEMTPSATKEEFIKVPIVETPKYTPIPVPERRIIDSAPKSIPFGPVSSESQTIQFQKPKVDYSFMETPVPLEDTSQISKMDKSKSIQPLPPPILQMPEQPKIAPGLGEAVIRISKTVRLPIKKSSILQPPPEETVQPILEEPQARLSIQPLPTPILQMPEQPKIAPGLGEAVMGTGKTLEIPTPPPPVIRMGKTVRLPIKKSSILQPPEEKTVAPILEEPQARLSIVESAPMNPPVEEFAIAPEMAYKEPAMSPRPKSSASPRGRPSGKTPSVVALSKASKDIIKIAFKNEIGTEPPSNMTKKQMIDTIQSKRRAQKAEKSPR
jgi:hypothetical protein